MNLAVGVSGDRHLPERLIVRLKAPVNDQFSSHSSKRQASIPVSRLSRLRAQCNEVELITREAAVLDVCLRGRYVRFDTRSTVRNVSFFFLVCFCPTVLKVAL